MSNKYNDNSQILSIYQRNENFNKRKYMKTFISNNNKIINSNLNNNNNSINHCFSKTTKNSPRAINTSKANNFRNKSFNLKYYSKQISKTNLKIENSLDLTGDKNNLKKRNLNIKTINMNLEIKKFQYETNNNNLYQNHYLYINANKNKMSNVKKQIYNILTNNNIKENNNSNKDNNRINTSIFRLNKNKDLLNKEKISPIKNRNKFFSINKKKNENYQTKNEILFNSSKNNFIKNASYKKQKNKDKNIEKIKPKSIIKDSNKNSKNTTPKIKSEKNKINNNKTKFNEISFNNIPKIIQFCNKKQTRNFNYHKKQPSLSLTKTSNISQCNFLETNSLDNMLSQITINKNQITSTSNYNNSTSISNDKSSQYNNFIAMYNKLINEKIDLIKENNELKQNNNNLYEKNKNLNITINTLKNIITKLFTTYKYILNDIINKFKLKENEMKNNLKIYENNIKKYIYYNEYYITHENNKNIKIFEIIKQTLIENRILRNLYNNLLLFDINNARLYTNPSENYDENEYKDNIKISFNNISNRSNKFLEEENNEKKNAKKRSDTAEQKRFDILRFIGGSHPQSRNYENKNELNINIINDNKNLKKCFIRKINYKIKNRKQKK